MRGRSNPAVRIEASVSRSARRTRSLVICDATSASEICEVTRAFHSPSSTLNSLAGPSSPTTSAEKLISSS